MSKKMIYLRLGMSESSLLFFYYLDKHIIEESSKLPWVSTLPKNFKDSSYLHEQNVYLNWLFSTSGFYDKEIHGEYFNFYGCEILRNSKVYRKYFESLLQFIQNPNVLIELNCHMMSPVLVDIRKNHFGKLFNKCESPPNLFEFMTMKNVLIVNSLSPLMKLQFDTGNVFQSVPEFPKNVCSIQCIQTAYTFFNDGPHENIFETCDAIYDKVMRKKGFDAIIISVGAYSSLLTQKLAATSRFQIFVIGGGLPKYFGIATKRSPAENEFFISVPENYRPKNFHLIEDGCYW